MENAHQFNDTSRVEENLKKHPTGVANKLKRQEYAKKVEAKKLEKRMHRMTPSERAEMQEQKAIASKAALAKAKAERDAKANK